MEKVRIQKVLAEAGVASRRAAEDMIVDGRVTVNGRLVTLLPCFVQPEQDDIRVDGRPIRRRPRQHVYFLLNKPHGVVCTMRDPQGRPRAVDLVPAVGERVYCVGGLDDEATGLVILTSDGQLTRHLTDPRLGLEMTYVVECDGRPDERAIILLKSGVILDGRRTRRCHVKVLHSGHERSMLEVRTAEGKNQVLRRIFHRIGHKVRRLKRAAIGPVSERGLKIGHYRPLSHHEVQSLWRAGQEPHPQRSEFGRQDLTTHP
ncbi:MAG: pseudouridine synthase [Phycisphaerae bacterium]